MQITMQRAHTAWPAKTKLRMALDCSGIAKNLACSRRLDLGDSAKRREQKKENNEGVGQGCERGNACKTSYKLRLVPVYQILVYPMSGLF